MSIRKAASWIHPRQGRSGPRGARTSRGGWSGAGPAGVSTAVAMAVLRERGPGVRPGGYYTSMSPGPSNGGSLELSGDGLTLDDAEGILRGRVRRLALAPAARRRVE